MISAQNLFSKPSIQKPPAFDNAINFLLKVGPHVEKRKESHPKRVKIQNFSPIEVKSTITVFDVVYLFSNVNFFLSESAPL